MLFSQKQVADFVAECTALHTLNCLPADPDDTPDFDAFEVQLVVSMQDGDGGFFCEPVSEREAAAEISSDRFDALMWTLYAHCQDGGVEALHDFHSKAEAEEIYKALHAKFVAD